MIQLTISIVSYKTNLDEIKRAVTDVLNECPLSKILIADNDSGLEYFTSLHQTFIDEKRVEVLSSGANKGYGFGHNFAVKRAPLSEFHLVMNSDIWIPKNSLIKLLNLMKTRPEIGLVVPKILNPDRSLQALNKRNPTILDMFLRFASQQFVFFKFIKRRLEFYEMKDIGYENEVDVPYASGCFMLFRRKCFEQIAGFDEKFFMYLEDADITRRIATFSRSLYYPQAEIIHAWSRGSYKNLRLFLITLHSMKVYFSKWGWKLF